MAHPPQHTQTCASASTVSRKATLLIAAVLLCVCRPTGASAQHSAGHGAAALPIGEISIVSRDTTVSVPAIPDRIRPDSLSSEALRDLMSYILLALTGEGRLMAAARVDSVSRSRQHGAWDVHISVNPGPRVPLADVRLSGDETTRPRTAALLAGVRPGQTAGTTPLDDVRISLRGSGLFGAVGEPSWVILPDSTARLVVPVEPAPPGSFDVTLGLLPGRDSDGGAQLVGSGSIDLRNAFGAGRRFDLLLDRRPGQTSHLNAGASDPFVAGLPIRVDVRFDGLQQDSTWSTRQWSAAAAYRFGISLDELELGVRYTREVTSPGQAGLRLSGGTQRIARSEGSFWGVEVALRRVDDPVAPRSGVILQSTLERGLSTYRRRVVESGDTTRIAVGDRRERMSVRLRGHVPVGPIISFVAGGDISILSSDDVDESDLFRIGGANSLRGYDEDRFRGTTVGRALIEVRSWFEDRSFASAFFDIGYVDRPVIRDIEAETGWHPGFGIGVQFTAPVGIMSVSYALNGEGGLREGRVHVGVRFGL